MEGKASKERKSYRSVLSNYRLGKTLGVGCFAKVKLAVHNLTGIKVAIKILDRQTLDEFETMKVRREVNIMRQLSHPHIVRLFEVIETTSHIYVVMEYMNSGELFYYITEKGRLNEDEARHFFQQIISGIEYCHHHMVVHRDLKPENLLLDSKRNVKIADFGLGNIMRDGHFLKTSCGSPNYAAPEVVGNRLYAGPEADVWSCGVILYALICGRLPFDDDNLPGLYAKIRNGSYTVSNHMSRGANDLIARIFEVNPVDRISIPEIRQHPWFQQHIPRYISNATIESLYDTTKVDEEVVREMVNMGFDICEVIRSVLNHLQNEITVTYYLLLHRQFQGRFSYGRSELRESSSQELFDHTRIFLRSVSALEQKWTLGFKLYRGSTELYVVDLQWLNGPPFLFLEICASFLFAVGVM
ncbi:SNF1-related protein kinase catalytic subunit alpha KIN10-like isoform X2 [Coffea eugenioides]|uniref:SNF1-related protein kinase catalytic subunit alpha KIN10-like isoform X2 n=1 Tax=Coffea eugenioides TaxID=49369 RepID=UPI000F6082AA|nr:SNF1-related protein kinase catalytic subunit alpha KIN10-like isoform X2 [Coffea eugenioides]